MRAVNHTIRAVNAVFHRADAAEIAHAPRRLGREARRVGVLRVEHQAAVRPLAAVNAALGRHVVLEIRMHIQMIRRNVRDDGHIRRAVHAVQLEAAELEHGKILRTDLRNAVKERRADVAAEVHGVPLRTQELGRDGRGRGLAVAAGDGDDAARARLQNASISEVRIAPLCAAARSCGTMGSTPGVRKMTSKSRCSR